MTKKLKIAFCFALTMISFTAGAQFFYSGNEDSRIKWSTSGNKTFQMVYPEWADTLANKYLQELEKYRIPVGTSLQMTGGQFQKKPLPVILHTRSMSANGMVTWAPRRMELVTMPEWSESAAMPWKTMLAIHEGRHFAQMQFGYKHVFKPFNWIFGEMFTGAMSGVYPGKLLLEGDAVIAETALTQAGRGRESGFLQYYFVAFDNNDWRNWTRWRLGSYYHPTPNYYAFGYLTLSGVRTLYDAPLFMADYFDYVGRRPYDPWPLRHAMRRASGKKFRSSFNEILRYQYCTWLANVPNRAPYMPYTVLSRNTKRPTGYSNPNVAPDGSMLWVKNDIYHNPALYSMDSTGKERRLFPVGGMIDKMNHENADSIIVWSELRRHPRWDYTINTVLRTYNTHTGRRSTIRHTGHYIYPIKVGEDFVAIDLCDSCCSEIVRFRCSDSQVLEKIHVPEGLQPTEVSHIGEKLYLLAISENGYGIYRIDGKDFNCVFEPIPVRMSSLEHDGNCLTFESDYDGSWELFRFNPDTGVMTQLTSSRYGANDYNVCDNGDIMWTLPSQEGTKAVITRASETLCKEVDPGNYYRNPIADKLSLQEQRLAEELKAPPSDTKKTPVKGWYKFPKAFNFHSWAPLYVDINSVADMSYESVKNSASLGAMVFFQSAMSSFGGYAGYQAKPDASGKWHHSGHITLSYSGLFPVFEAKLHVNETNANSYFWNNTRDTLFYKKTSEPLVRGSLGAYVPLSWSDETALYGVIPRVGVSFRTDRLEGKTISNWYGGVRGYAMSRTPSACVFPKWGVGAEVMYYDPVAYAFVYGYVPSFLGQGLKVSYLYQKTVNPDNIFQSSYAVVIPRGIDSKYAKVLLDGMKVTADYAIPFPVGDWHIGTAFYCKRGILTPHFDYSFFKKGTLFSAGTALELEFGSFLWIRTPITIGVTYSRNGGSLLEKNQDLFGRNHVEMLFNIQIPN